MLLMIEQVFVQSICLDITKVIKLLNSGVEKEAYLTHINILLLFFT